MINYCTFDWGWDKYKQSYPYFKNGDTYVWNNKLTKIDRYKKINDILSNLVPHPHFIKPMKKILKELDYYEKGMEILQPKINQQAIDMTKLMNKR